VLLGAGGNLGARSFTCAVCLRLRCSAVLNVNISRWSAYFSCDGCWGAGVGAGETAFGGVFVVLSFPDSSLDFPSPFLSSFPFSVSFSLAFSALRFCLSSQSAFSSAISSALNTGFEGVPSAIREANPGSLRCDSQV